MYRIIVLFFITFIFFLPTTDLQALELKTDWGLKSIETQRSFKILNDKPKDRSIVIAVIDTGADLSHSELKSNIWINKNELPNNGIDDDKNGYIDDINGWNFVEDNSKPFDSHGHGTHIAGIIKNIAPKAQLMILKYFDPKSLSDKNVSNTVRAIDYAIKNGANIINYSGGGSGKNKEEENAILRAKQRGIILVAAAGNENSNTDQNSFYPASYSLPNIISVASLTQESDLVDSSNFGVQTVDIAAPGKEIYSTLPNGRYGKMTGTSQATAFVTGVLANIMQLVPENLSSKKLIEHLVQTGELEHNLKGKTKYATKVNSYRALAMKGREINAIGLTIENTKEMSSDIFSSEKTIIDRHLNLLIEKINQEHIQIPERQ